MTNPADARRETETLLRTMEAAAFILAVLGALTLVVGGWIGVRTVTYTVEGDLDTYHPRLGLGYAVLVLTVTVAAVAGCVAWVLFTYVRPRAAALKKEAAEEQWRLAQQGW